MTVVLSPVAALKQLLNLDKKAALPLVAGVALIGSAAIVATWNVDVRTMGLMGLYILILGFILLVVANVLSNPLLSLVLGWFLTIVIIATVTVFFISAVFREQGIIKPNYCLVKFWERCSEAEAAVVERNAEAIEARVGPSQVQPPPVAPDEADPSQYRVFIRFAGLITRDSIVALNRELGRIGWRVQGPSGERLQQAQGLNEVRYSMSQDQRAAEVLAAQVTNAGITSGEVRARQVEIIRPGTMEVWISG